LITQVTGGLSSRATVAAAAAALARPMLTHAFLFKAPAHAFKPRHTHSD
jgi:hypothetical protein